jgi:large subunit ribosomal protein L21
MDYAIIKLGNKQHRVRDGETLVVDRLPTEEGKSFEPVVLLGDSKVTATIVAHERGPKIVVGKYRRRTGYKRHNGFRAATSRVEIAIGAGTARKAARPAKPQTEAEAANVAATEYEPLPAGLPDGYESMTVAQISAGAKDWSPAELDAALAYEQAHAARKGAISAIESAVAKEGEDGA